MAKDWTGNGKSVYITLGASNHTNNERQQHDYYATEPKAAKLLCDMVKFSPDVWECACGEGHLSKVLEKRGYIVKSTDLIERGYGESGVDFLAQTEKWHGDIITNPPYKYATEFVRKALELIDNGNKVAMFLKLQFLEGKERKKLFAEYPFKTLYVSSSRLTCAKNGKFSKVSGALAYGWYIWEKGYNGEPTIRWFN